LFQQPGSKFAETFIYLWLIEHLFPLPICTNEKFSTPTLQLFMKFKIHYVFHTLLKNKNEFTLDSVTTASHKQQCGNKTPACTITNMKAFQQT
jgi:hypothetical protein